MIRTAGIRDAFVQACALDVAVRKPGNVSHASPGHGMQAAQFEASAEAAAGPLCRAGASVGQRIVTAQAASWRAAGCNTNLGIVLLCAPLAAAAEQCLAAAAEQSLAAAAEHGLAAAARPPWAGAAAPAVAQPPPQPLQPAGLRAALQQVLGALDRHDAQAAFTAIAAAQPGGLGEAPTQDVHGPATLGLRAAMALAAERDRIARQYRDGFADLFDTALPAWAAACGGQPLAPPPWAGPGGDAAGHRAVLRLYLALLARWPDSHIVRKHGEAVAHTVMALAQGWQRRAASDDTAALACELAQWDQSLKHQGLNPGTTADLTVATLMLAALIHPAPGPGPQAADSSTRRLRAWHGT
ncbi:triphosphoribosyl-dephospho-CoA synthase [Aquabacterium sp. OR-4]|uniref:triphosphoribosyl-dephospho-CoA synthase n=1 Tax=Aquabacterium sp. OR-4 TaxID=2978127 RepID=UPI0021B17F5F|nr:triphosphoribosyl-dephospho-CoA synthase [Aquabacterium sp. OR-4]MDT7838282.1 triphosphoribosyl-dephospho-CoA synthase [Aquabacterium sp. OR-4]